MANGNIGPIVNVLEIISLWLKSYMEEMQVKVWMENFIQSTEELSSVAENFNKNVESFCIKENSDIFIDSMDVSSLYPQLIQNQQQTQNET